MACSLPSSVVVYRIGNKHARAGTVRTILTHGMTTFCNFLLKIDIAQTFFFLSHSVHINTICQIAGLVFIQQYTFLYIRKKSIFSQSSSLERVTLKGTFLRQSSTFALPILCMNNIITRTISILFKKHLNRPFLRLFRKCFLSSETRLENDLPV